MSPPLYAGPLQLLVLDYAGTTIDHGSLAPVGVFTELFRRRGVEVTLAEGREPMGVHKREHIRRMSVMPRVAAAWAAAHGRPITDADIDAMYAEATPLQIACLPDYCAPIPGVVEAVARWRSRGLRIAGTTGYNREMLDVVEREAGARGYQPDVAISAAEASAGRPAPYLCWRAAERLGVPMAAACVKAGDTVVDVEAGRAAGFWTVGVAVTGNMVGVSHEEWTAMDRSEQDRRASAAREALYRAGAHHVVDAVADLDPVLDEIEARLQRGERP